VAEDFLVVAVVEAAAGFGVLAENLDLLAGKASGV